MAMGQILPKDRRKPFLTLVLKVYELIIKDSNKSITPEYLAPIFEEEGKKVASLPGIKAEHVQIASEYMQGQVKQTWPSEFLTSDLMIHLEGVGTVGSSRKSAL
jgi:malate synthase